MAAAAAVVVVTHYLFIRLCNHGIECVDFLFSLTVIISDLIVVTTVTSTLSEELLYVMPFYRLMCLLLLKRQNGW